MHHGYDPVGEILFQGTGERRRAEDLNTKVVTAVAGNRSLGLGGDGGPATQSPMDPPFGLAFGPDGSLYITDVNYSRKPTLITRPDGQTIDFDYDTAGRLSTLNLPSRQMTYGYSATTGNLTTIADSFGSSLAYTYDGSLPKSTTWIGPVAGSSCSAG